MAGEAQGAGHEAATMAPQQCTVLYEPDNLSICIFAPLIPYFRLKSPFLCFYR